MSGVQVGFVDVDCVSHPVHAFLVALGLFFLFSFSSDTATHTTDVFFDWSARYRGSELTTRRHSSVETYLPALHPLVATCCALYTSRRIDSIYLQLVPAWAEVEEAGGEEDNHTHDAMAYHLYMASWRWCRLAVAGWVGG